MPGDTIPNFNDVIAALQLLGGGPGGVQNVPDHDMQQDLRTAITGRSGGGAPLADPDRPSWAAFRRLEQENRLLVDHVEMLACALGACPNCWGSIEDCEDCGGIGKPGAFAPDRRCFDHYVLPVIVRVMGRADPCDDPVSRPGDYRDRADPSGSLA
ncbi:hypothetical protein GIY56_10670 [Paracoccus sp. YIM 132242]|uniref:Uncharacterized protein n=1 Tax=Paracoccus lichenicola TaxID=2665644 RepID=A0A6L6HNM6_9RHOB|nr:hypothetical protein [Paracoccus lichenicola]MTE00754.1 hypothetical protein [Paracoccus lichenicola]